MKALVTAFEPFGGESLNASLEALRRLPARIGALEIETVTLPTSFARSLPVLDAAIARAQPRLVLATGQAGERAALCVERVAVNLQDAEAPDNDGARPVDVPGSTNEPSRRRGDPSHVESTTTTSPPVPATCARHVGAAAEQAEAHGGVNPSSVVGRPTSRPQPGRVTTDACAPRPDTSAANADASVVATLSPTNVMRGARSTGSGPTRRRSRSTWPPRRSCGTSGS